MIPLLIKQISELTDGQCYFIADDEMTINAICTDSRKIEKNSIFIALIGDNFDGHQFAKQAILDGAAAIIVDHKIADDIAQIVVKDTRQALGKIAAYVRQQMLANVVALTGSSGKTSVKEMTAAILQQCGQTLYTQGNFNNDIGVPLTLFRMTAEDKFAVIELGANHIGEISYTTQLVKPQSALINNIAEAHIEGFGSLAGVAQAKGEIFKGLPDDGIAIINLDSFSKDWYFSLNKKKVWTFSLNNQQADFHATDVDENSNTHFILHTPNGQVEITLPVIGLHNVSNAIAAGALAMSVGATLNDIQQGLKDSKPVKGRLFPIRLNKSQLILDDSYNANMGSMTAAIDVLAKQSGHKVLVVGDMAELGDESEKYHQQIGELAKQAQLDCVVSVGKLSEWVSKFSGIGHHFQDKQGAVDFLLTLLDQYPCLTMLVKGSRSSKMEDLIEGIKIKQLKMS